MNTDYRKRKIQRILKEGKCIENTRKYFQIISFSKSRLWRSFTNLFRGHLDEGIFLITKKPVIWFTGCNLWLTTWFCIFRNICFTWVKYQIIDLRFALLKFLVCNYADNYVSCFVSKWRYFLVLDSKPILQVLVQS